MNLLISHCRVPLLQPCLLIPASPVSGQKRGVAAAYARENIAVDNVATPDSGGNYRWTVFLRSANSQGDKDIAGIASVTYVLHPSFTTPQVEIKRFERRGVNGAFWTDGRYFWSDPRPFAYNASGWGGFYMKVRVRFNGDKRINEYTYYLDLRKRPAPGKG